MRSSQVVDIREAGPLEDKQSPTQHNFQAKSQATDAAISAGAMSDVTNKVDFCTINGDTVVQHELCPTREPYI